MIVWRILVRGRSAFAKTYTRVTLQRLQIRGRSVIEHKVDKGILEARIADGHLEDEIRSSAVCRNGVLSGEEQLTHMGV